MAVEFAAGIEAPCGLPSRRSQKPLTAAQTFRSLVTKLIPWGTSSLGARFSGYRPEFEDARDSGKGTAHASITCHLACHNFVAGSGVEYGDSGTGMHRGAVSLRWKRTAPRPSPRASKCHPGLASNPGKVTWGNGCRRYVSGQQADSLPTCPWQRRLALFRPWWSVSYRLKRP